MPLEKVHVLSNGYDEEDFERVESHRFENGKFNIVYTGSFLPGYSPDHFFEGMKQVCSKNPNFEADVKFHLAGTMEPHMESLVLDQIQEKGLASLVHYHGYLPHRKCVNLTLKADLLLLILWAGRGSENCIPAKCYEYLRAGKPILALIPRRSECASLIKKYGRGLFAAPDQLPEITQALENAYRVWREKESASEYGENLGFRVYDRVFLTQRLAGLFDRLLDGVPA